MMTTWDSMVELDSTARLIDAFVNSLNLSDYGIKEMAQEGRRHMIPRVFISSIFMAVIMELNLSENWQRIAKSMLKSSGHSEVLNPTSEPYLIFAKKTLTV